MYLPQQNGEQPTSLLLLAYGLGIDKCINFNNSNNDKNKTQRNENIYFFFLLQVDFVFVISLSTKISAKCTFFDWSATLLRLFQHNELPIFSYFVIEQVSTFTANPT